MIHLVAASLTMLLLGQAAPDVVVTTTAGPLPASPLLSIEPGFAIKLGGKNPRSVSGRDLVAVKRIGVPQPGPPQPPTIELTTGELLSIARLPTLNAEDETLSLPLAGPLATQIVSPQAMAARITLADFPGKPAATSRQSSDQIVLRNGDRLDGKLVALDAGGAKLKVGEQTLTMPADRIAQISFDPDFRSLPRRRGPTLDAVLRNGDRVSFSELVTGPKSELIGTMRLGPVLKLSPADLTALRVRGGAAVYLDDLKPTAFTSTPFFDIAWPMVVGKTIDGQPLRGGPDVFPLGLAMHTKSVATFAVEPGAIAFETLVAIDPNAGPRGLARIEIAVDGKTVGEASRLIKAGEAPVPLRVPLDGAKTLTLIADFGPRGDVDGRVLWLDPRLIRKSSSERGTPIE